MAESGLTLLRELRRRGWAIKVDGGHLMVKPPNPEAIADARPLLEELRRRKAEALAALQRLCPDCLSEDLAWTHDGRRVCRRCLHLPPAFGEACRPRPIPPEALAMLLGLLDAGLWLRLAPSDRPPGWFVLAEGVPHCGQAELDKLVDQYLAWHDPAVELLLRHCAAGEWNRLSPLEQRHRLQDLGTMAERTDDRAGSPEPSRDTKARARALFDRLVPYWMPDGRRGWIHPDYVAELGPGAQIGRGRFSDGIAP